MKRVRGETLSAHARAVTSLSERLGIFERICDAVNFAHAQGIVHRDLKPDNVMIGQFGEVLGEAVGERLVERVGLAGVDPLALGGE